MQHCTNTTCAILRYPNWLFTVFIHFLAYTVHYLLRLQALLCRDLVSLAYRMPCTCSYIFRSNRKSQRQRCKQFNWKRKVHFQRGRLPLMFLVNMKYTMGSVLSRRKGSHQGYVHTAEPMTAQLCQNSPQHTPTKSFSDPVGTSPPQTTYANRGTCVSTVCGGGVCQSKS